MKSYQPVERLVFKQAHPTIKPISYAVTDGVRHLYVANTWGLCEYWKSTQPNKHKLKVIPVYK